MFEEIAKLLSEQLDIPVSKITLDSNIIEDLGADSLDIVEMRTRRARPFLTTRLAKFTR